MGGQIAFIVWRESVEALLVIGILNAWLMQQADPAVRSVARRYLWSGVVCGIALAALLAMVLLFFSDMLSDDAQDYFQIGMVLVAAALILQMVWWMHKHGRTIKRELHQGLDTAASRTNWWTIFILAAAAVAREGSETVVFLYGVMASGTGDTLLFATGTVIFGFLAALFTYWLLQVSSRFFSWRSFFAVTQIMLLMLASSLLLTGVDRLIGLDILPALSGTLWDTSWLLDDSRPLGGFISTLTGYRAKPDLTLLITYIAYWLVVLVMFLPKASRGQSQEQRAA